MKFQISKEFELGWDYAKFPNGFLICWGECYIADGAISGTITFPQAFQVRPCLAVLPYYTYDSDMMVSSGGITETSATIYARGKSDGITHYRSVMYIAIGHWK